MEKKEDQPFINLETTNSLKGVTSNLFRVPGHEDLVIRKSFVDVPEGEGEKMDIHERAEYLKNRAVEFKKIVQRTGIPMAETSYVIGTDPIAGKPAIFGATEWIDGENLESLASLEKETADKVDTIYAKIIFDLFNSYKENTFFWCDPQNAQFMFGKTKSDEKPNIYLVDVDPDIIDWSTVSEESKEHVFWNRLFVLLSEVEKMEEKMQKKGYRFKKSREAIDKIKTEIFVIQ